MPRAAPDEHDPKPRNRAPAVMPGFPSRAGRKNPGITAGARFPERVCRAVAAIAFLAALSGCVQNEPGIPIEEEDGVQAASLLSSVNVADPQAEPQLLRGFHGLEQRAWRWTERKFSVMLQPPPPGQPVVLNLTFTLPGVVTESIGPIRITARVNGQDIGSESFAAPGENLQMEAVVPDGLLTGKPAEVEFELDKAMPPGERDPRELGIVVSSVAFQ